MLRAKCKVTTLFTKQPMAQNTQSFAKSRPLWLLQAAQLEICPADKPDV